jgi:hypothetical protein
MADQELTPALLRADADDLRAVQYDASVRYGVQYGESISRAAAALEEQAARLEQGERVCRWVLVGEWWCPCCGGRVVLGDEEGGR